ncbi:MAG: hypothetical protein KAG94_06745 [Clostridiales bacterium]|nr:hypothetical protein [Clostridiales bacterium]
MTNKKRKSSGCLTIFLVVTIILLAAIIFFLLFPKLFINFSGKELLDTVKINKIHELNNQIPSEGNFFVSAHYTDIELTKIITDQLNDEYPVEDIAISFNDDQTIDLALLTNDFQLLFDSNSVPLFLLGMVNHKNIYANLSIVHIANNDIEVILNEAFVEELSIPTGLFDTIMNEVSDKLENTLNQVDNLSLTSINIDNHLLKIDGVIRNH